jgi:hypothetical protein
LLDKSLRKGTIWTIIFFLASFAKTIILTPLMLLHWGADDFSDWAILLSARAVILFLSDGYVRYIVNQYNLLFHTDEEKANDVLSAGVSFIVVLSVILCSAMVILIWLNPYAYGLVFGIEINEIFGEFLSKMAGFCLIVYIVSACMQTIQRMYAGTKEARGLVWKNLLMETVLIGVEIGLLSLLLLQGFRLVEFVLADSGLIILITGSYLFYLWKKYPLAGMLKLSTIKSGAIHFAKATQLYAGNFFEKLTTDGLVLLLSFFRFDKSAIALFATIRTIVNTPLLAQNLLLNTYTPQLQKDFALRNNEGLKRLFSVIRLRVGLILVVGIVCCYPLYEPVFMLWTKGEIVYNETFMVAMLMMAVFNLYGLSFAFVLKGLNVLPQMLGLMIFKIVLILAGFYFARQNIEITGWTLAATEFISSVILLPILLHRFWQRQQQTFSLSNTLLSVIPYLLAAVCLFLFALK